MTAKDRFSRDLESWLADSAATTVPPDLHAQAIQRVGGERQRPRWLVDARGDTYGPSAGSIRRPAFRLATALVVGAVVLALVVAAIAGVFRTTPTNPLGRNGVIVYSVFENKQRAGQTSLTYLMNADGSNNRQIAQGTCPTFSKDGQVMAYRSNWYGQELLVGPSDGSAPITLPILLDHSYRDLSYALSPDGTQVAWFKPLREIAFEFSDGSAEGFGSKNELWVTPVAGGPGVRIVPESPAAAESYGVPVWSPDGSRIAFEGRIGVPSSDGPSYRAAVYVVDVAESELRRVSIRPSVNGYAFGMSWSPDGRYLAYLGLPDGAALPLIASVGPATDPPLDVFVVGVDGVGDQNVTRSPTFESQPKWSPGGTQLAYLASQDGERYRLMSVEMVGPAPTDEPIAGPESRAFTWSPDGSMLLSMNATSISSIDSTFLGAPSKMVDVSSFPQSDPLHHAVFGIEYEFCAPSWQWLQP